jgi:hypothetical protein
MEKQEQQKQQQQQSDTSPLTLVLDNFQANFGELSDLCKAKIRQNSRGFWRRYVVDFLLCNFLIAPFVISFWRGTWDHSLIYLDERLLKNVYFKKKPS